MYLIRLLSGTHIGVSVSYQHHIISNTHFSLHSFKNLMKVFMEVYRSLCLASIARLLVNDCEHCQYIIYSWHQIACHLAALFNYYGFMPWVCHSTSLLSPGYSTMPLIVPLSQLARSPSAWVINACCTDFIGDPVASWNFIAPVFTYEIIILITAQIMHIRCLSGVSPVVYTHTESELWFRTRCTISRNAGHSSLYWLYTILKTKWFLFLVAPWDCLEIITVGIGEGMVSWAIFHSFWWCLGRNHIHKSELCLLT